jgi:RNA polymerase sigma-70 factor, ECF subfamily
MTRVMLGCEVPDKGGSLEAAATKNSIAGLESGICMYEQDLIRAAYRITCDMATAQDIVQDTYLDFLQSKSSFKGLSSEKTYFYRIVINKSIDSKRRQRRWWGILDKLANEDLYPRPETAEVDSDSNELVRKALGKIPDVFRIPLLLADVDGMSYEEIAETLGISLNTVRSRIFRCREKLSNAFKKAGYHL